MSYYNESFGQAFKRGWMTMPVALRYIITINVVVFAFQLALGPEINRWLITSFGFIPELEPLLTQPWRIVTYMFLHGSFLHILFNMLWLWWMGRPVEDQLGPRNFLVLYFGAGIGGALINTLFAGVFGGNLTIGASGGVLGMMVCYAMLFPRTPIMLIFFPPIEARFVVAGLIAIDFLLIGASDNVARVVHLGGAFTGFALLKLYYRGYDYDAWLKNLGSLFSRKTKPKSKPKQNKNMRIVEDAEIIEEVDQSELDIILEKISKKGYEGLSAEEKRKLFELSKKR